MENTSACKRMERTPMKTSYDYVIIGSGFGGSVTAYRIATARANAGQDASVCVLERGKRYNMGEFSRDFGWARNWWWRHEGRRGWRGLFEFHLGDKISIVCGAGVGGTSLVYLDVQLDAFATTFDIVGPEGRRRWPESVNWAAEMPRYYALMKEMMRPSPIPDPPLKALALQEAARGAGLAGRFRLVDLAVFWGKHGSERGVLFQDPYDRKGPPQAACQYCGECFIGCNTHSKNTVDLNFLWFAERAGAEVYSQHRVSKIEPRPEGGYTVYFDDLRWGISGVVIAKTLVISAGCAGSTTLLLRAKYGYRQGKKEIPPTMPRISDMLGKHFSGNGDFGAVAFETCYVTEPTVGPSITAAIDCRDQLDGHGFLIEDGGFPDTLRSALRRLPGGLMAGRRLVRWLERLLGGSRPRGLTEDVFEFLDLETVRNALPYLAMGIDAADGELTIDAEGTLVPRWRPSDSMHYFRTLERTLRAITQTPPPGQTGPGLKGNLMLNPTWSSDKHLITVHPLGGCPMGDDASRGVVSPNGEVFGYPNLYVADGSIVPSALGPNPSKTIGALAQRISDHLIRRGIA